MSARIVFNRLLGSWFIVRGRHDSPIGGAYRTRQDALDALAKRH